MGNKLNVFSWVKKETESARVESRWEQQESAEQTDTSAMRTGISSKETKAAADANDFARGDENSPQNCNTRTQNETEDQNARMETSGSTEHLNAPTEDTTEDRPQAENQGAAADEVDMEVATRESTDTSEEVGK